MTTLAARPSILENTRPGVRARRVRNVVATVAIALSFAVAIVPLTALLVWVVSKGAGVISGAFLTQDLPIVDRFPGGGIAPAIVGTLVITGGATVLAVPLGVLGGIYLSEYGVRGPASRLIRFLAEVMTGVPSIVMGLFVYTFWVLRFKSQTGFAGALALASLMLPIVIRSTDEMLRLVPRDLREGSYALGARRARTIRSVVFPHAVPGIMSGALLAVARAAGETAPLLFTIGLTKTTNFNLFGGVNTALSQQIWVNAQQPFAPAQERAFGSALTLIVLVFVFTVLARIVTAQYSRRVSAA